MGMTKKQLKKLFKVFETVKQRNSALFNDQDSIANFGYQNSTSGFGLGLFLSK